MPTVRLSDKYVERLNFIPDGYEEYFDLRLPGFGVRVGGRSKVWFVSGRVAGKRSFKKTLGRVGQLEYLEAFDVASSILRQADKGVAPGEVEAKQSEAEATKTLRWVLGEYLRLKRLKPRTVSSYNETVERYIPEWLDIPLPQITADMLLNKHVEIGKRAPSQADYVGRIVRALFNFCDEMYDDLPPMRNPVKRLSRLDMWYNLPRRQTFLHPSMLPKFFTAIERNPGLVADYLVTLLLTGARKGELARLKPQDVHLDDGFIILRDTKGVEYLPLPVCNYLLPVLGRRLADPLATEYLFYSTGTKKSKSGCLEDTRIIMKRMFPKLVFTPHDLRRTYLTYADEADVSDSVKKRLVGHAEPMDVTQGYIQFVPARLKAQTEKVAAVILGYAAVK